MISIPVYVEEGDTMTEVGRLTISADGGAFVSFSYGAAQKKINAILNKGLVGDLFDNRPPGRHQKGSNARSQ